MSSSRAKGLTAIGPENTPVNTSQLQHIIEFKQYLCYLALLGAILMEPLRETS